LPHALLQNQFQRAEDVLFSLTADGELGQKQVYISSGNLTNLLFTEKRQQVIPEMAGHVENC